MSPLWRDEIGAYLSPHRLCLVRMQRGVKPVPAATHEQHLAPSGVSFGPALEAFASVLAQPTWAGTRTRIVIADHWARYAIVPPVATLSSAQERLAYGRQLLAGLYGEAVEGWELCISEAAPNSTRVICAVPGELLTGLRAACAAQRSPLVSLQPQLIAAYETWRHRLPSGNAWFVSIEQGSLAAAHLSDCGWDRVHGVRIGPDWLRELKRLQTFGRLAGNSREEGKVYVDAPVAWREVVAASPAAADATELEWLEESSEALTTLQRLDRARRMAA